MWTTCQYLESSKSLRLTTTNFSSKCILWLCVWQGFMIGVVDITVQVLRKEMAWKFKHAHFFAKTLEIVLLKMKWNSSMTTEPFEPALPWTSQSVLFPRQWLWCRPGPSCTWRGVSRSRRPLSSPLPPQLEPAYSHCQRRSPSGKRTLKPCGKVW